MLIRSVATQDVDALVAIYNDYIENTAITFEEDIISAEEMMRRVEAVCETKLPWLVLENDQGRVAGFAYASIWHGRSAYRFTVEATVYLASEVQGQGQGRILYLSLIERLRQRGIKQVIGCIALPNDASVGLHHTLGFVKVGEMKEVGLKFDQWWNVGFWQLSL